MTELSFVAAFLIGLAGSVHCFGMCGGIVSAFNYAIPSGHHSIYYTISYNVGRILSYCIAGAVTALLGKLVSHQAQFGIVILQSLSAFFLFLMACYIGGWWQGLVLTEKIGMRLWTKIRPWSKRFIPFKHPIAALPYGMVWGWLPCGLVYSTLTWALASADAVKGASIMLGFGLGTFPVMILIALGINHITNLIRHPITKHLIATLLALYSFFLLFSALQ